MIITDFVGAMVGTKVYSTGDALHGRTGQTKTVTKWTLIETLRSIPIIQISTGHQHSLFLDENGLVYGCGNYIFGSPDETTFFHGVSIPKLVPFFPENKIFVRKVSAGYNYSMVISNGGNIYSWGKMALI